MKTPPFRQVMVKSWQAVVVQSRKDGLIEEAFKP